MPGDAQDERREGDTLQMTGSRPVAAGVLLRTIVAPWAQPRTVTADEWCAAVDEYFLRMEAQEGGRPHPAPSA